MSTALAGGASRGAGLSPLTRGFLLGGSVGPGQMLVFVSCLLQVLLPLCPRLCLGVWRWGMGDKMVGVRLVGE